MDKFWIEHVYLLYLCTVGAFGIACYFVKRWFEANLKILAGMQVNIKDLYDKYNNHEHRLSELEGEHKVYSKLKH